MKNTGKVRTAEEILAEIYQAQRSGEQFIEVRMSRAERMSIVSRTDYYRFVQLPNPLEECHSITFMGYPVIEAEEDEPREYVIVRQACDLARSGALDPYEGMIVRKLAGGIMIYSEASAKALENAAFEAWKRGLYPLYGYLQMQAAWVRVKCRPISEPVA